MTHIGVEELGEYTSVAEDNTASAHMANMGTYKQRSPLTQLNH